jgi:subtilisin family serine protease
VTAVPPPPDPRRRAIISPLALGQTDNLPPNASQMVLADEQGRRLVLVELRVDPGADSRSVRTDFLQLFADIFAGPDAPPDPTPIARHYLRCVLSADEMTRLVQGGTSPTAASTTRALQLIYRIWPDLVVKAHLDRSVTTIKADAAARTFDCTGAGVVWAVLDSGIDATHPHFATHKTLTADVVKNLHRDFTIPATPNAKRGPLTDLFGHGTHVAGIIAGQAPRDPKKLRIACNRPIAQNLPQWVSRTLAEGTTLSGVAPKANLVSLKVLDDNGSTVSSVILDALNYVREINSNGRNLRIHGVNLSLGCPWPPTEFAAGQSPLCREVDLLTGMGVTAVVSAGNAGASGLTAGIGGDVFGQLSTITDPGNAATAITVGSVHRDRPHTYGITFNSSKGPTMDGRPKPDLVAPGEAITSAATGRLVAGVGPLQPGRGDPARLACYVDDSGTSMAAAHVSGAVAAFLSARAEYIGQPQMVKQLFVSTATDLGRHEFFQGAGLVDLMRVMSTV